MEDQKDFIGGNYDNTVNQERDNASRLNYAAQETKEIPSADKMTSLINDRINRLIFELYHLTDLKSRIKYSNVSNILNDFNNIMNK